MNTTDTHPHEKTQPEKLSVNDQEFKIIKLLGKGKGGYSWLAAKDNQFFVLKQIHHEPCSYYQFGDKIRSEFNDYSRLKNAGIRIPEMLDIDFEKETILKQYIDGPTIVEIIQNDQMKPEYYEQIQEFSTMAKEAGLNIDYYPTNFVVQNDQLFYIDYECNPYMEEWNLENWGIQYWSKTEAFDKAFEKKKH